MTSSVTGAGSATTDPLAATKAGSTSTTGSSSKTGGTDTSAAAMQDRFLKLLVAQLTHQDPMNPMDNAAMTTQMAQISTVNGIQQLNTTMSSMISQIGALQTVQGVNLTGHQVLVNGNTLSANADGSFSGSFRLDSAAESASVDVLSPGGQVVDTIQLGAQSAGVNDFSWNGQGWSGTGTPTFRMQALAGGQPVTPTTLTRGTVQSVSSSNGALQVNLGPVLGNVPYSSVASVQ